MDRVGFSIKYKGYCDPGSLPVKKGDTITLLKGMKYEHLGESRIVKRKYTIKVHHMLAGVTHTDREGDPIHRMNPSIRWAGSGGYWCGMDINEYLEGVKNVGS